MIDEGIENLGSALRVLAELVSDGLTDAQIANRMEVHAIAVTQFTRREIGYPGSGYGTQLLAPKGKFGKTWRELLQIGAEVYQIMRRWHAEGYDYVCFYSANSQCYPCTETDTSLLRKQYTGGWSTLDKMISVYCHGGVLLEPSRVPREADL